MFYTLCVIIKTILQHVIVKWLKYLVAGSIGYVQNTNTRAFIILATQKTHSFNYVHSIYGLQC